MLINEKRAGRAGSRVNQRSLGSLLTPKGAAGKKPGMDDWMSEWQRRRPHRAKQKRGVSG